MDLPPKLWFRFQRLKKSLRSALGVEEQRPPEASHRMCPNCRGLVERSASVCPLCGISLRSPRSRSGGTPGRVLGVIPVPSTATSVFIAVSVALYAISWYMTQTLASAELNPAPALGGVDPRVLGHLGAKTQAIFAGQWWRLVTAIFLHAGLFHIGMNLWCLVDLGPTVESLFSSSKFVVIYLVTGVAGFALSAIWNPYVLSIGASGAILGLIGILIGTSYRHGHLGRDYRKQLWRWVIYILIFGLLPFFAVDNAAHVGGLVTGLVLGYLMPEGEPSTRTGETFWNALAVLGVIVIAVSFVMMALQLGRYSC